jgi:hypothetical protein
MSEATPQPAPQPTLLDPDTAYATVHQRVYTPVFFQKLARDFGLKPETEKDAMDMLMMAAQLRESYDQQQEKQGSAQSGTLAAAKQHLGMTLAEDGTTPGQLSPQVIEKAATERAADPELAHAVLSLQAGAAGITPEQLAQPAAA